MSSSTMETIAHRPPGTQGRTVLERQTRGGRKLLYSFECIQHPERSRACGSGPKSTSDRRPIDPCPVVQLRIFENGLENTPGSKEITYDYNANFFVFASLEIDRPIAHGRVQPQAANTPPVLTGMPVAGCCYLDRPEEAGYFLFPDLSVRHEGCYRLAFTLYEYPKDEKDLDAEEPETKPSADGANEAYYNRMTVRSDGFTVYSAKKFPGLMESTTLSRTVAEQGCRVRIRRDVRMRRRDGKKGRDAAEVAEEEMARHPRASQTPDVAHDPYRTRSASNSSIDRAAYGPDLSRRPSEVGYPIPPPPFAGSQPASQGGHLGFMNGPSKQYAQPPFPSPHGPQSSPISPAGPYQGQQYRPAGVPVAATEPPPYYARPPSQPYIAANDQGMDYEPRRQSLRFHDTKAYPQPAQHVPAPSLSSKLPPINVAASVNDRSISKIEPASPHTLMPRLAPLPSPTKYDHSQPNKRGYGEAFNDSSANEPQRQGERLLDAHHREGTNLHDQDPYNHDSKIMQWRSANGAKNSINFITNRPEEHQYDNWYRCRTPELSEPRPREREFDM